MGLWKGKSATGGRGPSVSSRFAVCAASAHTHELRRRLHSGGCVSPCVRLRGPYYRSQVDGGGGGVGTRAVDVKKRPEQQGGFFPGC